MSLHLESRSSILGSRGLTILKKEKTKESPSKHQLARVILNALAEFNNPTPMVFKRVTATNQQIVEFSYSLQDKQVIAHILKPAARPVAISPENLPREVHCIRNLNVFFNLLSGAYIRVSLLSDGAHRIYVYQKLLGGASYKESFERLKEHLFSIFNTYVVQDVVGVFKQISGDAIDISKGIMGAFKKLPLPKETLALLEKLNDQIVAFSKELDPSQFSEQLSKIKADFGQLLQMVEKYRADDDAFVTWPDLDVLLALPQIRRLSNDSLIKIKRQTDKKDVEGLRDLVQKLLQDNGVNVNDVDEALANEYGNLYTLLGEIIDQRPQKKEGLDSYWDYLPIFFEGKTLFLTDPTTGHSYTEFIFGCQKEGLNWIFQVESNTEIEITPQYVVTIRERSQCGFWKGFFNINNLDQVFEVICTHPTEKLIVPGFYKKGKSISKKDDLENSAFIDKTKNSSQEIELLDGTTGEKRYLIKAYYQGEVVVNSVYSIEILSWAIDKGEYVKTKEKIGDTPWGIDSKYKINIINKKTITKIDKSNIYKFIIIKQLMYKSFDKQQFEKMARIRDQMVREENRELLNILLEDFIKNKFRTLSMNLLRIKQPQLAICFQEMAQKWSEHGQTYSSPEEIYTAEEILKTIVAEANYVSLVGFETEQTIRNMQLTERLTCAYNAIKKIENKDTILIMGNRGSGKSTVANYFLGTPLESFTNRVGDRVLQVKEGSNSKPNSKHPKIGQNLGEASTFYAEGYELEDKSFLVDCPGFAEINDSPYGVCANFSMDNVLRSVAKIKAIVLTIPIAAFLMDRGNGLTDLVEAARDRFPWTFDVDQPQHSSKVYVLVTKIQYASSETVANLKDGTRITEFVKEGQKRIERILQRSQETGQEIDSFELEGIKRRNGIWRSLQLIQSQGRFDFVDTANLRARVRILEKYRDEGEVDKRQYVPVMERENVKSVFKEHFHLSVFTWTYSILKPYLEIVEQLKTPANQNNELLKKKRNLAIIIRTQGQLVRFLREFAGQVVGRHNPKQNADSAVTACQEFIGIYDQNMEQIEKQCDEDLTA